jgi:magnesium-transporting ATPase (P-type)
MFFSPDEKDVVTVFHGKIEPALFNYATLGWWILGAVLLLIIIILILWKVTLHKLMIM